MRGLGAVVGAIVGATLLVGCTSHGDGAATPEPTGSPTLVTGDVDPAAASVTGGTQPLVKWPAVDGAATYLVAVVTADGSSWAWQGAENSVVLGGGEVDGGGLGFRLGGDATLFVTALDAGGEVLSLERYAVPFGG